MVRICFYSPALHCARGSAALYTSYCRYILSIFIASSHETTVTVEVRGNCCLTSHGGIIGKRGIPERLE